MIPASIAERQLSRGPHRPRWQADLAEAFTDPGELLAFLGLDPAIAGAWHAPHAQFPLRVPRSYAARIRRGDPHDPLLRQVLPIGLESAAAPGFGPDPLAEQAALAGPGLLRKYAGRALLITTGACGVHCRYCFRREFPYVDNGASRSGESLALDAIERDQSIREVLLSGGDPWSLTNERLTQITRRLQSIAHVERIRVHTRQPIVLPSRVDVGLLHWVEGVTKPLVIVVHANHPNEIDADVRMALLALRARGATVLNQSVLLAGVNDTAAVLHTPPGQSA
jgi:EF-P beta-lysylation protein EpmB